MKVLSVLISMLFCGCAGLNEPVWMPDSPDYIIKVKADSLPSGADLFAVNSDGTFGGKIGITPCVFDVAITIKHISRSDNRLAGTPWANVKIRSPGGCGNALLKTIRPNVWGGPAQCELSVNCAAIKTGYQAKIVKKELCTITWESGAYEPEGLLSETSFLIPLNLLNEQILVQPPQQQQQQQQQQQTIVVGGQKSDDAKFGTVIVSCAIEDAEIFVDGIFVGNVPANLELSAGIHIIEVRSRGYQSYHKEVRVLANCDTTLRASLVKE